MQFLEKSSEKIIENTNIQTLISQENKKSEYLENEKYQNFEIKKYLDKTNFSSSTKQKILEIIDQKGFCTTQIFSSENIIKSFLNYLTNQFLYIFVILGYFVFPAWIMQLLTPNNEIKYFLFFCLIIILFFLLNILVFYKNQINQKFFTFYNSGNSVFMKNDIYNKKIISGENIDKFLTFQQKLMSSDIKNLSYNKNQVIKPDLEFMKIDGKNFSTPKTFEVKSNLGTGFVVLGLSIALIVFSNFMNGENVRLYQYFFGTYFMFLIFTLIFLPIFKNLFIILSKKISEKIERKIKNFIFYDSGNYLDANYKIFEDIASDLETIKKYSDISKNIKTDFLKSIGSLDQYNKSLSDAMKIFENISKNLKKLKNILSFETNQKIFSIAKENISNVLNERKSILDLVENDIDSVLKTSQNITDPQVKLRVFESKKLKKSIIDIKQKFQILDNII